MAEIKIEKKQPIWPWVIIGLLILAFILYFFVFKDRNTSEVVYEYVDSTSMGMNTHTENDDAVSEYLSFVSKDADSMSLDHEYSADALTKLTNATEAIAIKTAVNVNTDLEEAKQLAQQITRNPTATTHADDIRKANVFIATALRTIQQSKYPSLSVESDQVMNDAKAVKGDDLTLDQKDLIKTFYNSAADLLQKMNTNY